MARRDGWGSNLRRQRRYKLKLYETEHVREQKTKYHLALF